MVKILEGIAVATVVTSTNGEIIAGCEIIGEGLGPSEGLIILSDVSAYYIPKTTPDLTTTIDKLIGILTPLSTALTGIQTSLLTGATDNGGASAVPVADAIVQLTLTTAELTALKLIQK